MSVELTEAILIKAAGWEEMKRARAYVEQDHVLSSQWSPPLLRGVVQAGEVSYRASMVIRSDIDVENQCPCRDSQQWGRICAHSVAVGLHWIQSQQSASAASHPSLAGVPRTPAPVTRKSPSLTRAAAGEPATLHIILPPNLDQAISRGRIMLVFEAQWRGGRNPLNALPRGKSFCFNPADDPLIDKTEDLAGGETPAMLQLPLDAFAALLPLLADHPNISLGKSTPFQVRSTPATLPMRATLEPDGQILIALKQAITGTRIGDWVLNDRALQPLPLPDSIRDVIKGPVRIPRPRVPEFMSRDWPRLAALAGFEAGFTPETFVFDPQPPSFLLELTGGLARLGALLQCAYGSRIMTPGITASDETVWLPDPKSPVRYSTRDVSAERAALDRLRRQGFTAPDDQGRMMLLGQNAVLNFFAREYPKLQREWTVTLEERLDRSTAANLERIAPRFEITPSGVQWFDLGVVFASSGGETFSAAEIQRLLLSGQSHAGLKNGKTALLDTGAVEEFQQMLLDCAPRQHERGYRIENRQAGFLDSTLRQHATWGVKAPDSWKERAAKQRGDVQLECPPLGDLEPVLRPYQKAGLAWLRFLREQGFGGVLADEMGLGKTLQTLAWLRFIRRNEPGGPPMLVVCPTSLVFNWEAEAKRFTPELSLLALHGAERHGRWEEVRRHDLVVTSYALLRRDAERYAGLEFDTVVLDEAQHIKNRQTQNAQAVKSIQAPHRLVLTGTPLENSVLDLWSIFDFLMPGYLGSAQDFRERYEIPIAREKDSGAQARLARRLRPFLLRRLKREVATDLPERIEQIAYCELTREQKSAYQQILEASRKELIEADGPGSLAKSRMLVLSALLRLRQVCCDLRLLKPDGVDPGSASGKMDLFAELLEEVLDGGHRVLVFSQFTSMLALLKEKLAAESISFAYLDGSTGDRAAVVDRFQRDPAIPVFLISLKAGGVGLNLTGADTVIHFDPWWNPAVEDQATDRAHRIGQTRVVTSYKLITRDTIEEKILTLQNRKREIIQATVGGEEEFASALGWDEIRELLG